MPEHTESKLDIRVYIGLVFFYWQTIALCFLYSLLGGVIYIQFAPKQYRTSCKLMVHRDVNLEIAGTEGRYSPWRTHQIHSYFLKSVDLRKSVAEELVEKWGDKMGSVQRMMLNVDVAISRAVGSTLDISINSRDPGYAEDFLNILIERHRKQWQDLQLQGSSRATEMLDRELSNIAEEIEQAENDLIEYQRLHDIARVEASASMESQYLSALMSRKSMLSTELMLLESQNPILKGANAAVISDVARLTRETGEVEPPEIEEIEEGTKTNGSKTREIVRRPKIKLPDELTKGYPDSNPQEKPISGRYT